MELSAPGWADYELLDSGDFLRLERIGDVVISRQSAQAVWARALDKAEWGRRSQAAHFRRDQGPGEWTYSGRRPPESWIIALERMRLEMRLTPFGHIGMFPEQQAQWPWITEQAASLDGARVLNLFAYTGGSTLAAALGGGRVTHVDAVKGIITWARANASHSGLSDAPIRWIVDDALKFVRREHRRGKRYDAIILDPPTFGRGPQGTVWKIERDLLTLLDACEQVLSERPLFVLLSGHTPGFTAAVLRNVLHPLLARRGGRLQAGDMVQAGPGGGGAALPAGVYCRWLAD